MVRSRRRLCRPLRDTTSSACSRIFRRSSLPVSDGNGEEEVVDIGPAEQPSTKKKAVRPEPVVTGAGRVRSLNPVAPAGVPGVSGGAAAATDWTNVGRNDPCPCGSGKKFKKCHGANA